MVWTDVRLPARGTPVALVLHGVGSTGEFAQRCLGPALRALGYAVVAPDLRGHGRSTALTDPAEHSVDAHLDDVRAAAAHCDVRLVAGVSLGAHVALRYAAERPDLDGALLCLPGVVGPDSVPAAANRAIADLLAAEGTAAVLDRIDADPTALRWVVAEVRRSWSTHDARSLVAALRAVAEATPLGPDTLALVRAPVGVVAVVDDPAHPVAVARALRDQLPRAALVELTLAELGDDRARLGRAATAALVTARATASR